MGTPSTWVKTTPYGSYLDLKQNHKENTRNTEQYNLINRARNLYKKHPGSKSMNSLRMYK